MKYYAFLSKVNTGMELLLPMIMFKGYFTDYFKTWKLQPNPAKTEVTTFHLN